MGGGGLFITTAYIREKERPKKYKILKEGDRGLVWNISVGWSRAFFKPSDSDNRDIKGLV